MNPGTLAQDRSKSTSLTPRFETTEERKARLEKEKEFAELQGDIAVSFRLSAPNPRYIYFTEVPEGYHYCSQRESLGTPEHAEYTEQQPTKHISFSNTSEVLRSSSYARRGSDTKEQRLQSAQNGGDGNMDVVKS